MSLITMDAVRIESLPSARSLLNAKVSETTDISKEKDDDILFIDDIDEDDEIRLRLSDEEEIEQDNTSGHSENQLKKNDLEFNAHTSVASKEVHSKELTIIRDQFDIDTNSLADDDKSSDNCDIEEGINENCSINEEESTMSGSHHNSPKYWSNYDKRWKGVNSSRGRQSYPHRNSNDWYHHQQYPENNKFIPKTNNYNNRNNPNNRLRSSTRGNHNNQFRESSNKEVKKEDFNESPRLRSKTSKEENQDKNQSIKENGVAKDLNVEENDHVKDDTSAIESTDFSNKDNDPEIDSDQKENKNLSELNSSSAEKCKKDDENNDNEVSKNDECNMEKNEQNNKNTLLSTTKDCDVSMTEEQKCELKSKTMNKEESECISNETEKEISSDSSSLSNSVELKDSAESEVSSESVKIAEVASHDENTLEKDSCEKSMEIDENIGNLCETSDKHSDSGEINASGNAKDSDKEISESSLIEEKIEDEKDVSEKKSETDSTNENSESKLNNDSNLNENSNHSVEDEKSVPVSEMEISEANDGKSDQVTTGDKINEVMDVDTDSSNSLLIAVADAKGSDLTDSKLSNENDDNTSADENSMVIDETNTEETNPEKETSSTTVNDENKEVEKAADVKKTDEEEKSKSADTEPEEIIANIIEEVDLVDDELEVEAPNSSTLETNTSQVNDDAPNDTLNNNKDTSQTVPISSAEGDKVGESNEEGRAVVHKRRRRKRTSIILTEVPGNDLQTENGVRQKRRSARNAEEMIRKGTLKDDEAENESTDDEDKLIPVNYKKSAAAAAIHAQPLSPPSLKRTLEDIDCIGDAVTVKRIKHTVGGPPVTGTPPQLTSAKTTPVKTTDESSIVVTKISTPTTSPQKEPTPRSKEDSALMKELVRKISTDDIRTKLKKLKQEELEALLLQKIVECITIRGEMGQLREEARASKRNQEATRVKCQQLQKQVEGFDMVLKRISYDKNSNSDKYMPPIKINRSVGLQVNFLSPEHGVQNLKQIQTLKSSSSGNVINNGPKTTSASPSLGNLSKENIVQQQKMVKTRSPRRFETTSRLVEVGQAAATTTSTASIANSTTTTTAAPLVMSKGIESNAPKRTLTLQSSGGNIVQILPPGQQQTSQSQQAQTAVVVNSAGRPATLTIQRATTGGNNAMSNAANNTSDLIDLTDEEDKTKTGAVTPITTALTTRLPRVLQAVPASVALSNSSSLRLIQTNSQGSPTAIVNNVNGPRLAYVMQSNGGVSTRQIVLTNSPSIRPANSVTTRNISTISYKQGVTLPNGTVRVLTTQAPTGNSPSKHPAPLPETPVTDSNPLWKLAPPAPSLKISKVATGIVLSWNMTLSDKYAEIVSYQLYAYQEVAGTNPSAAIWKKVGDVRALPLPMACTLTQFTEGNNYYFAVRAVDVHSRFGQYSKPGNISL